MTPTAERVSIFGNATIEIYFSDNQDDPEVLEVPGLTRPILPKEATLHVNADGKSWSCSAITIRGPWKLASGLYRGNHSERTIMEPMYDDSGAPNWLRNIITEQLAQIGK